MPHDMLRTAVKGTIERSGIDVSDVDYAVGDGICELADSNEGGYCRGNGGIYHVFLICR